MLNYTKGILKEGREILKEGCVDITYVIGSSIAVAAVATCELNISNA
jgi:hypothetical protein